MNIDGWDFLIGADPELFIVNKRKEQLVSAHGLLPGTKEEPFLVKHGAIQVDGMAAEFNIDPASSEEEFIHNVVVVKEQLQSFLPDHYELHAIPVAHFGTEMIKAQPIEARILGCEPDFNAWHEGEENPKPNEDMPFRTGSGHIHIGWTEGMPIKNDEYLNICHSLVQELDYWMMATTLFDQDQVRRELYGKPGAYRPKSYGLEYRVLSNKWVANEKYMGIVYQLTMEAIRCMVLGMPSNECQYYIRRGITKPECYTFRKEQLLKEACGRDYVL